MGKFYIDYGDLLDKFLFSLSSLYDLLLYLRDEE